MQRRDFITATAAVLAVGNLSARAEEATDPREYIEIRTYYTPDADSKQRLLDRVDERLIPVRKRLGFAKTGAFSVRLDLHEGDSKFDPKFANAVFVVTSAPDFASFEKLHEFEQTSLKPEERIQTFANEACYSEFENSLLRAFPSIPKLEIPTLDPERVVQYRCYYSPSPDRNRMKLKMFDVRGELDLFRRCGMPPVLYGEMMFGTMMPNISYFLSFQNNDARLEGWKKFINSDEWKVMRDEPQFKDTCTRLRNLFLKPSPGSEI